MRYGLRGELRALLFTQGSGYASLNAAEQPEEDTMTEHSKIVAHTASADFVKHAHLDAAGYDRMYAASIADPDAFWGEQGKRLDWIKPYTRVKNTSFAHGDVSIKWFEDGVLNVAP